MTRLFGTDGVRCGKSEFNPELVFVWQGWCLCFRSQCQNSHILIGRMRISGEMLEGALT